MPIRELECRKCKTLKEVITSMDDPCIKFCDKCGQLLHRVISASSFHLKGGGWAKDNYNKKNN